MLIVRNSNMIIKDNDDNNDDEKTSLNKDKKY